MSLPQPPEPEWLPEIEPGTDVSEDLAATLFARKYANRMSYCHDQGNWYEYDGSIHRLCTMGEPLQYARVLARLLSVRATAPKTLLTVKFARAMVTFAEGDDALKRNASFWDKDVWLLGTPSGTVDLRTGRLRISRGGDYITKSVAVAPSPKEECPLWLAFLNQATGGDVELIRFLKQIFGYALSGSTREQAMFFVYGGGGNGKGVFVNTLNHLLGDYATTATMDMLLASKMERHTTDFAMLRGSRLVSASETEEGRAWAEAKIKQMTGGDPITARLMRENNFTFTPQFKLLIIGNHKPDIRTVDDAMRRRLNIIPFKVRPANPDLHLEDKLRKEWPGILRWAINGCMDWNANGLKRPQIVIDATNSYFSDQDTTNQWLSECCDVDLNNPYLTAQSSELFNSWTRFAKAAGEDPKTNKTFSAALERLGFEKKVTMRGRFFHGLQLKRSEDSDLI